MNCEVCNEKIRRDEPHYRGYAGKGPWKHIGCCEQYVDCVDADKSIMLALRELKKARFEIRTHRWRGARPMLLKSLDYTTDAIKHLAILEASA